MKVVIVIDVDSVDPKFKLVAENATDEILLKQLSGIYGTNDIELETVEFKGNGGVSSLVIRKEILT